jgi:hypothetical protein
MATSQPYNQCGHSFECPVRCYFLPDFLGAGLFDFAGAFSVSTHPSSGTLPNEPVLVAGCGGSGRAESYGRGATPNAPILVTSIDARLGWGRAAHASLGLAAG